MVTRLGPGTLIWEMSDSEGVMSPKEQAGANVHYQVRLVKRLDGRRVVTHHALAQPKELRARDKTLDFGTERGALQAARNYSARGEQRKGPLPGDFVGTIVVKHISDPTKFGTVKLGNVPRGFEVTKRPRRLVGTTTWLYYVDPNGKAFHVNGKTHRIGDPV